MITSTTQRGLLLKTDLKKLPPVFRLKPHLPIDQSEMAGLWRSLKSRFNDRNLLKLVLLIDQQGSMAPFSSFIEEVTQSLLYSGLFDKISRYYFHDCPESFLWRHPSLTLTLPLEEVLSREVRDYRVLIVSDAGAAHGNNDRLRLATTHTFLNILKIYTPVYAWLNPMPSNRWEATTAEDIAYIVPMFHMDKKGLNDAITYILRYLNSLEVNLNE